MLTTIDEVIATGLRISTIDGDDTLPDISEAIEKHLLPVLGAPLIAALNEAYAIIMQPPPMPPEIPDEPAERMVSMLPLVQKPLAAFAYLAELPASHARITSAGVRRTSTDNMPTAYKWEYEKAESYLEERAYSTLDTLLSFIDLNFSTYEDLLEADLVAARKGMLIKSGKQLQARYPIELPYLSWFRFLPFFTEQTETYIIPAVGRDFYNELLGVTNTDATTDPDSEPAKFLLLNLQLALANLVVCQVVQKGLLYVSGKGITTQKQTPQGSGRTTADSERQLAKLEQHSHSDAKMYLRRTIVSLNSQASPTLFNSYYTSSQYTPPTGKLIDRKNDQRKVFRM